MIRLASVAVLLVAGLLAVGGFLLVRSGGPVPQGDAAVEEVPAPVAEEDTRVFFLADQDLETGLLTLVLHDAGENDADLVVTDQAAIRAARDTAYYNTKTTGGQSFGALALAVMGVPPQQRIVSLYRDDTLVFHLTCGSTTCGPFAQNTDRDLAGLLDVAQPLVRIEESFDNYSAYLDALAFVAAEPDFALLGLGPALDMDHPVPQQTPSLILGLPTISRLAEAPLDVDLHAPLLEALVQEVLPPGAEVTEVVIRELGNAVVLDADNNRPATRGGAEIPFPGALFYNPRVTIQGTATLPAETLQELTEITLLEADWQDGATAFITGLGLDCSDCFTVQLKAELRPDARVISFNPEFYFLSYYDLRDAP